MPYASSGKDLRGKPEQAIDVSVSGQVEHLSADDRRERIKQLLAGPIVDAEVVREK